MWAHRDGPSWPPSWNEHLYPLLAPSRASQRASAVQSPRNIALLAYESRTQGA